MCACLLAWLGWVESASEGLHLCCDRRGGQVEALTTPSQRRYVQYFSRLLDCEPLKREALLLRFVYEMEYDDIAVILDATPHAVRKFVSKGLGKLRKGRECGKTMKIAT